MFFWSSPHYDPTFFGVNASEIPWGVFEDQVITLLVILAIVSVIARVRGLRARNGTLAFVIPWLAIEAMKLAVFLFRYAF